MTSSKLAFHCQNQDVYLCFCTPNFIVLKSYEDTNVKIILTAIELIIG